MPTLSNSTVRIPVSALSLARSASCAAERSDIDLLVVALACAEPAALDNLIKALTTCLHQQTAKLSNEQVSVLMRLIGRLDEQREEAELAANPERRAGLIRIRTRLAHEAV